MVLPIVRPRFPDLGVIKDKFNRCLYQGQVANNGEHVRRFEQKLEEYLGVPTLTFCNGQTALMAMLLAGGLEPGDWVAMPSFTFCGTAAAVSLLGGIPLFCEIDPATLTLCPSDVDLRTDFSGVKFIMGVDVYGICCNYPALQKVADKYEARLLFDSAPAFGALFGTNPTGRHGDAQIFSFHATKPFSTMEGGCLCTRNPEIYQKAKAIRDFGQNDDKECVEVGLNGKMLEVCALIGLELLKTWPQERHLRTFKARTYAHRLAEIEGVTTIHEPGDPAQWPNWTYMPILIEPRFGQGRDGVLARLNAKHVMARKYYAPACHMMRPFYNGQKLPITEEISSKVIALPMYSDMSEDEIGRVVAALNEVRHE